MPSNPDFHKIFAADGDRTEISDADYKGGWNDIVGENPPSYKQFNFMGNRTDVRLNYLNHLSSLEWQYQIKYYPGQLVRIPGSDKIYVCKIENENKTPTSHTSDGMWAVFGGSPMMSLQEDGYIKLPEAMGHLLVQWKKCVESTAYTDKIAWPIPFPNAVFNVQATRVQPADQPTNEAGSIVWNVDPSGFVVTAGWQFGNGKQVYVLGIGY
ncbi:gp53-like domain-containing protein [Thiolapillus sp.]|uniref:gp53-like domain-containing protein n=1 Tax=Thiolapillus sp. TaxID=2017437 RepID=UPI003AF9B818